MLKCDLDTPSLILDLDIFEKNLETMRDFSASAGKKLRPHAKTHKCPEIARRQLACGNCAGICAAKLSEAEGLAAAGMEQNVVINAEFPNATNSREIEDALNNLVNRASQHISK